MGDMTTECKWRYNKPVNDQSANPWQNGRLIGLTTYSDTTYAVVATDSGYPRMVELTNLRLWPVPGYKGPAE